MLKIVHKYLNFFKQTTLAFSGDKSPSLPSVIININILIDSIEKLCFKLNNKIDRNSVDETLILAFQSGREKILKYYNKTNWIYCSTLILDPRHKLEVFDHTFWGRNLKTKAYKKFEEIFKNKYIASNDNIQDFQNENSSENEISDNEFNETIKNLYNNKKKKLWTGITKLKII